MLFRSEMVAGPFDGTLDSMDAATEQNMSGDKNLPSLEGAESQQWEENGVHWSRDANGQLSYYDATSEQWLPFEG